ncbi:MAG: LysR substrate-binding domain-containing protein [Pseudomonadota bacterium]
MNLRFLRSVVAVAETGSLVQAAERLGVSHSALSQQIKALEEELQIDILDRTTRPPQITDRGLELVGHARRMLDLAEEVRGIGSADTLTGVVRIGVVPSALVHLMPPVLARLRAGHAGLDIQLRSGLSDSLVADVRARDLDMALVTQPEVLPSGLIQTPIAREPLDVVTAEGTTGTDPAHLITGAPFIWFNRRTWAGQQIERHLRNLRIAVSPAMEVDSLEAVEALVAHGLGVSVSPRRLGAPPVPGLRRVPLGAPHLERVLSLVRLERCSRARVVSALEAEFAKLGGTT